MPEVDWKKVDLETFFDVNITGKCNFRCKFCTTKSEKLPKKHMGLQEFKDLILEIKQLSKQNKKNYGICVAGGEPFLNPNAVEMVAFAVKHLGRRNVEVTTNLSKFPTDKKKTKDLMIKMGRPKINFSIDREHLKFGKRIPKRIKAACTAAKELSVKVHIINVTQNKYQQTHPWPREIVNVIPASLKKKAEVRLEQYSRSDIKKLYDYLKNAAAGKKAHFPLTPMIKFPIPMFEELAVPVKLGFAPGGKVYLGNTPDALHFPQLSVGNWRRESLQSVVKVNNPFKRNFLRNWFGYPRRGGKFNAPEWARFDMPNKKKQQLFAQSALRRFREQRKRRTGK